MLGHIAVYNRNNDCDSFFNDRYIVQCRVHNNNSLVAAEMGNRLARKDMGRKVDGVVTFSWGSWVANVAWAEPTSISYQVAS